MKSIFSDKASLILRHMLADPNREWVVRDFEKEIGVGRGWAAKVLSVLRDKSYLKGESRGRAASSVLRNADELINEWTQHYRFDLNKTHIYYASSPDILSEIKRFFGKEKRSYALTLHSGANLLTNYVRTPNVYIYLGHENFQKISTELRRALDLKELKQGGNVYFVNPYYKKSAFFGLQTIKGYPVVSTIQLYLDLFHFTERGREHADYLLRLIKEKEGSLA